MTKFSPLKISSSSWRTLLDIVRPNFSMRTTRIVTHSNFARISWLHALFKKISLHTVYVARYTIYFDAKLFWRSTPTRPIDIVMFRDLLMQLHLSKNLNEIWNLLFCRQHLSSGSETYQNASWYIFAVKKKYHRLVIFYTIMVPKAACH